MKRRPVEHIPVKLLIALSAAPVSAAALAFVLPYMAALFQAFSGASSVSMLSVFSDPFLYKTIQFTLLQAGLSTLAALALGLPGAWLIGAGRFKGSGVLRALSAVPFAMPPILVVLGFVLFFGNAGWANRLFMNLSGSEEPVLNILYRPAAIILAHAFYNFPIILRLVGDSIAQSRLNYSAVAASLGASGPKTFITILLPLAFPSVIAASLLVFLYCFTSFAVVLVLGGGPATSTLAVEIYRYARISLDFRTAGALAAVETGIAAIAFLLYALSSRWARSLVPAEEKENRDLEHSGSSITGKIFIGIYLCIAAALVLGPLLSVPLESFLHKASRSTDASFSLHWWSMIGSSALPALGRSILLAAVAASLATIFSVLAGTTSILAKDRKLFKTSLSTLVSLPLASSGIVLALGWLILYGNAVSRSFWSVAFVHAVSALPFAFRSVSEGLAVLPPSSMDAAAVYGASPFKRTMTIALPCSAKRIRSAWSFSAAISLGELNAVLMLGLDNWETLPLLIYRAAGSYRFGAACAAGTLLAICCATAFAISEFHYTRRKR